MFWSKSSKYGGNIFRLLIMTVRNLSIPHVEVELVVHRQVDFQRWSVVLVVGSPFEEVWLVDFEKLAAFGHILWIILDSNCM